MFTITHSGNAADPVSVDPELCFSFVEGKCRVFVKYEGANDVCLQIAS